MGKQTNTANNEAERKLDFLKEFLNCKGLKSRACKNSGVDPDVLATWLVQDSLFMSDYSRLKDFTRLYNDDTAEEKLLQKVEAGDTTAIIFYNKTRNKDRGYSERDNVPKQVQLQVKADNQHATATQPVLPEPTPAPIELTSPKDIAKRIRNKRDYIVRLLKDEGKYTKELSMQVNLVAQLMVRTDDLRDEIFSPSHKTVNVEISREGNDRLSVNPVEKLYLEYVQRTQRALQALGMNTDSKERKTDNDSFNDYLSELRDGD